MVSLVDKVGNLSDAIFRKLLTQIHHAFEGICIKAGHAMIMKIKISLHSLCDLIH